MRIALVSHYALPHLGGIEAAVDALARELVRRGHEVTHVASAAQRPDDPPALADPPYRRVTVRAWNGLEERVDVPYPVAGPALNRALAPVADVRTVPNGVDTERFAPPGDGEKDALRRRLGWDGRLRALFVGRLVQKKGIEVVLAAADRTPEVEWVLAGPGSPPRTPPPNVDVLGPVSPDAMHELYRAADLLVLPSHGEGFPLSIQEAMASGLPVVAADDPVYRSGDGPPAGLVLAPADAEHVTSAVHRLAADPSARAALGAQARDAVLERFSWSRSADVHEQLYLAAAGRA